MSINGARKITRKVKRHFVNRSEWTNDEMVTVIRYASPQRKIFIIGAKNRNLPIPYRDSYHSQEDLLSLIRAGIEFRVVEKETMKDITQDYLMRIALRRLETFLLNKPKAELLDIIKADYYGSQEGKAL